MNWIINLVSKITGIDSMAKKMDGFNTKGASVAGILTGVAGLIMQFVGMPHDVVNLINFAKGLPTDPAWLAVVAGWIGLGLGRKMEKAENK